MGTMYPEIVELEVDSDHQYLSHCHVATTERGFNNPQQQCFCIERKDDASTN